MGMSAETYQKWVAFIMGIVGNNPTHSHTFTSITEKPAVYPPEAHVHDPLPPAEHSHTFDQITAKPTSYPPNTHQHSKSDIPDFGGPYAAENHSHPGMTSPTSTCKQTAQVLNNSNTTPSDIPGMAFTLVAGHRYYFRFMGKYRSAATTTGVGFTFTGPAITSVGWSVTNQQAAAGTDHNYQNSAMALATVLVNTGCVAANTDYMWQVEGFIEPSANGTLQLRCRSEINASQITIQNVGIGILEDAG